jgi:hypothetical protein
MGIQVGGATTTTNCLIQIGDIWWVEYKKNVPNCCNDEMDSEDKGRR